MFHQIFAHDILDKAGKVANKDEDLCKKDFYPVPKDRSGESELILYVCSTSINVRACYALVLKFSCAPCKTRFKRKRDLNLHLAFSHYRGVLLPPENCKVARLDDCNEERSSVEKEKLHRCFYFGCKAM